MQEVCRHAVVEPTLQSLFGETLHPTSAITSDAARLSDGFWDCGQQSAFFDIRIFNPIAHTCHHKPLSHCYRHHELERDDTMRTESYR